MEESQESQLCQPEPYTILERDLYDGAELVPAAALAAAGINVLSITRLKNFDSAQYLEKPSERYTYGVKEKSEYIAIAVCYEFQWKNRGNYTWSKVFNTYTLDDNSNCLMVGMYTTPSEETDKYFNRFHYPQDWSPHSICDISVSVIEQMVREVILARDQLESPDDRGFYMYYWVPEDLPEHIKKESVSKAKVRI